MAVSSAEDVLSQFREKLFVAFDIESTGFQPVQNRMIELSAVKFTGDGQVLGEFDELIDPGIPIPEGASKVNHIYDEDVRGKPKASEILSKFADFVSDDSILIAHNSEFDVKFVGSEFSLENLNLPENEVWDSLPMAREYVKNIMNHKMETLVHHFGFKAEGFHRALVDSYHVMHLFLHFVNEGRSFDEIRQVASPRRFNLATQMFQVQLPLPLMALKKSLKTGYKLKFTYEMDHGDHEELEVEPHVLYRGDKFNFLYATPDSKEFPGSFRLDRLSKPKVIAPIS